MKAAARVIVTVERILPSAVPRRAGAHDVSPLRGRHRRRGAVGRVPDLVVPDLRLRRRVLRGLPARARRPGDRRLLLGGADRGAGDARRLPRRERRPGDAARGSPGGRRERRDDRRADGRHARAGVHERDAGLQRRGLLRARLRLPPRARRHAPELVWAASSLAVDADPKSIPESTPRTGSGTAPRCSPTPPTTSGRTRRAGATTRSPCGAQMDALRERQQHDDRPVRLAQGAPAGRRRDGGPRLHDPAHLPLVDDARRADVRRAARLPLGDRLGRRRRPPRPPRAARRGRSSASRTSASSTSTPTRSGCGSAASTRA